MHGIHAVHDVIGHTNILPCMAGFGMRMTQHKHHLAATYGEAYFGGQLHVHTVKIRCSYKYCLIRLCLVSTGI